MNTTKQFPTPRFSKPVYCFSRLAGSLYVRLALGINVLKLANPEVLSNEIKAFKEGRQSLIITFRHTAKEDAPALLVAVKESHLCFLYGRDVLNWAGRVTRFLFPRLGFVAVQNRGNNKEGMHYLRKEVQQGRFPIALAPEGQVTYHGHRCEPIEMGVANLASWALEGGKEVVILPIAIGYRYADDLETLLARWQKETGEALTQTGMHQRLFEACNKSLELVASFFGIPLPEEADFIIRRNLLCEALLCLGEAQAGIQGEEGSILDRLFRLRYRGEDTLFNQEEQAHSLLQRAKATYRQAGAHHSLRISQVVDILEYLDPSYLHEGEEENRLFEVALNLLDINNRLCGGSINTRYSPKGKRATILAGEPIRLTAQPADNGGRRKRLTLIHEAVYRGLQQASRDLKP